VTTIPLKPGDVLDMGEGRRAVIIGRAAREPVYLGRYWRPTGAPDFAPGIAGYRWTLTAYGWHIQYLDTGELATLGNMPTNRLGERPYPVLGRYAEVLEPLALFT
jgi:hypothetical protein